MRSSKNIFEYFNNILLVQTYHNNQHKVSISNSMMIIYIGIIISVCCHVPLAQLWLYPCAWIYFTTFYMQLLCEFISCVNITISFSFLFFFYFACFSFLMLCHTLSSTVCRNAKLSYVLLALC